MDKANIRPASKTMAGHKGYGLMLWNELFTTALGGWGRADNPDDGDANSVLVQVIDPEAFGSLEAFKRQADHLVHLCHVTAES